MYLSGLGTAVPETCYSQADCWQALKASPPFQHLQPRSQGLLRKVLLGDNGISTRTLALDGLQEAFEMDPDSLQQRFERHAPALAEQAAHTALSEARLQSAQIDAVVVSTCTGYICPGLSSYVAERLGLPVGVRAFDLVGQGCGAALPNASLAKALLSDGQAEHVLCVCVEVCSAAMYLDDDPGVLISACLFGDGAAAAVWSNRAPAGRRLIRWVDSEARLTPANREALRFEHNAGRLRNILRPNVPEVAAEELQSVLSKLLPKKEIGFADISTWILHAGGRNVLNAIAAELQLNTEQLSRSAAILDRYGNLSSPFVYFVLQRALRNEAEAGWWCFSSFGAGFSCQAALLEVGKA